MKNYQFQSNSEEETFEIGRAFGKTLSGNSVVSFYGDLGAGKTEFVKGICEELGVKKLVTSPTFSLMNKYEYSYHGNQGIIYHIDLYRIKSKEELFEIGFNECVFSEDAIKLVEWADNADGFLPENRINITILNDLKDANKRKIIIENSAVMVTN
jgi:tRNA threonylcarbamoyladenosine biosynthesis protein TsaE